MIAIINIGNNPSPVGKHEYRVQINNNLVCTFTHQREKGLAQCLREAAKAVEHKKRLELDAMINSDDCW